MPVEKNDTQNMKIQVISWNHHSLIKSKAGESIHEALESESQVKRSQSLKRIYDTNNVALFSCEPQFYENKTSDAHEVQAIKENILVENKKGKKSFYQKKNYKTKYEDDVSIKRKKVEKLQGIYSTK